MQGYFSTDNRISIHAPREGCDSTSNSSRARMAISIHAPREGCDAARPGANRRSTTYFNPRTPRGVRPGNFQQRNMSQGFQSTHPARGATYPLQFYPCMRRNFNPRTPRGVRPTISSLVAHGPSTISIHAPREGCDVPLPPGSGTSMNFNPRTPRGVRPHFKSKTKARERISIHAPRVGCDRGGRTA